MSALLRNSSIVRQGQDSVKLGELSKGTSSCQSHTKGDLHLRGTTPKNTLFEVEEEEEEEEGDFGVIARDIRRIDDATR